MKIIPSKHLDKVIDIWIAQYNLNVEMSAFFIDFFAHYQNYIDKKTIQLKQIDNIVLYRQYVINLLHLEDLEPHQQMMVKDAITLGIQKLMPMTYQSNPYYQRVRPVEDQTGRWRITYETYQPFQPFVSGDIQSLMNRSSQEITPIGYFTEPFRYLVIKEGKTTWMSVTPFEINSMQPHIDSMHGKVITLGLGLGYFAYMTALKPEVNHVTIIEKDLTVIQLFKKHILPFFPHKEKITIIHMDAFEYLSQIQLNADHIFVDIYRTADDGLPLYIRFKGLEKNHPRIQWSYWLEQSMLGLLRRYLILVLQKQLNEQKNNLEVKEASFEAHMISEIMRSESSRVIQSEEDLNKWLSDQHLLEIIRRFNPYLDL
jgi:hypothetical protein